MAHTFAMEYCSIFIESGQGFFMHKDNKENATDPTSKPKIFTRVQTGNKILYKTGLTGACCCRLGGLKKQF